MRMKGIVYKKVVIGWCGVPHWSKGRARAVFWQCWPRHNANRGSRGNPRRAAMGIRLGTQPVLTLLVWLTSLGVAGIGADAQSQTTRQTRDRVDAFSQTAVNEMAFDDTYRTPHLYVQG